MATTPKISTAAVTSRGGVQHEGSMKDVAGSGGSSQAMSSLIAKEGQMPVSGNRITPGKDLVQHPQSEFYGGGKGLAPRPGRKGKV